MGHLVRKEPVFSDVFGGFSLAMIISEITGAHPLFSPPTGLETRGTSGCLKASCLYSKPSETCEGLSHPLRPVKAGGL